MAFLKIRQGDSYPIPIVIKQGETVITDGAVTGVRIGIGKYMAYYPDGSLTYDSGVWYFPFSQKMSYDVGTGDVDIQVQCAFSDGTVLGSSVEKIKVKESLFKKEWNVSALGEQSESENADDAATVTFSASAGLVIQLGNIPQIVVNTGVSSVNGQTGDVVITAESLGIDLSEYVQKTTDGDVQIIALDGDITIGATDSAGATATLAGSNVQLDAGDTRLTLGNGEVEGIPYGLSVHNSQIHDVADPTNDTDAANRGYVDSKSSPYEWKVIYGIDNWTTFINNAQNLYSTYKFENTLSPTSGDCINLSLLPMYRDYIQDEEAELKLKGLVVCFSIPSLKPQYIDPVYRDMRVYFLHCNDAFSVVSQTNQPDRYMNILMPSAFSDSQASVFKAAVNYANGAYDIFRTDVTTGTGAPTTITSGLSGIKTCAEIAQEIPFGSNLTPLARNDYITHVSLKYIGSRFPYLYTNSGLTQMYLIGLCEV